MRSTSGGSRVAASTRTLRSVIQCDGVVTTLMADLGERRCPPGHWRRGGGCHLRSALLPGTCGGPPLLPPSPAPASKPPAASPVGGHTRGGPSPPPPGRCPLLRPPGPDTPQARSGRPRPWPYPPAWPLHPPPRHCLGGSPAQAGHGTRRPGESQGPTLAGGWSPGRVAPGGPCPHGAP